jgi:hypothetical protein
MTYRSYGGDNLKGHVKGCVGKFKVLERKGGNAVKLMERIVEPSLTPEVRYNARFQGEDFCSMLEHAAFSGLSIEGTSSVLQLRGLRVPSSDQMLRYYEEPPIEEYMGMSGKLLTQTAKIAKKQGMFRAPCVVALDPHDQSWYGNPNAKGVRGTKNKNGTSWCHSFVCLDVVTKGEVLTLGFLPRGPLSDNTHIAGELLKNALKMVEIWLLLADREFFTVDDVLLFQELELKFIVPAKDTEEVKRLKREFRRQVPCVVDYTMRSGKREAHMKLALVEREGRHGKRRVYGFVTNLDWEPEVIAETYRSRWQIETDHRTRNEFRIRTSTGCYELTLLFFLLMVVLRNIWALANSDPATDEVPLRIYLMKEHLRGHLLAPGLGPPWE